MIEPKFYLKNYKTPHQTPIIMTFRLDKKLFRYSIGRRIKPILWNSEIQRPLSKKNVDNEIKKEIINIFKEEKRENSQIEISLTNINNHIENVRIDCINIYENLKREFKSVSFDELKRRLKNKYSSTKKSISKPIKENSMSIYIEGFLDGIETGERKIQLGKNIGKVYAKSTIKTFKEWGTQFKNYQSYINRSLDWNDISDEVYNSYISFFNNKKHSYNNIGKQVKNLKTIMSYGLRDNQHNNSAFKNFTVFKTDITKVVLSSDEVEKLYNHNYDDQKTQDDVNIFLLSAYTTLRFSDANRIESKHIDLKNQRINIIAMKTKKPLSIPISKNLLTILKRYNYKIPKTNSQRLNKNIKNACEELNIDDLIEVKSIKGGQTIIEHKEKWELVSAHTGRRTACTNMFLNGIKPIHIMKLSGHSKESTFMKYIILDNDETAKTISENKFFK